MKKTLIALTLAALVPVAAYAAMDGGGRHDRGARLERMAERLDLDDTQKMRLKALFEEHNAERKALREQMRTQIDEILTESQRAKMEEMRSKRRGRHQNRRGWHQKRDFDADDSSDGDSSDGDSSDDDSSDDALR